MKIPASALSRDLNALLTNTRDRDLCLGTLIDSFPQRGHALLIVVLSFPLTLPLSIPFIAGPFGVVIAFLGFFLMIGRKPWLPKRLRQRPISRQSFERIVEKLIKVSRAVEHLIRPRMARISLGRWSIRVHAFTVMMLGLLLALPVPLPIPFSNTVVAIPIFLIGLGLLEEDGLVILLGYATILVCGGYYGSVIWVVRKSVLHMLHLI